MATIRNILWKDFILNKLLSLRYRLFRKRGWDNTPANKGTLVFEDNFNEISWARPNKKWNVGPYWGKVHPENSSVYMGDSPKLDGEGNVILESFYKPFHYENYAGKWDTLVSANKLVTQKHYKQQYGWFESRLTYPTSNNDFPAWWLWGTAPTKNPDTLTKQYFEVDIWEVLHKSKKNRFRINLHWRDWTKDNNPRDKLKSQKIFLEKDLDKFHTFALDWQPNHMKVYVDDMLVFIYRNKKVLDNFFNNEGCLMWLCINHGFHESGVNNLKEDYYSSFKVDWVKAYAYENSTTIIDYDQPNE
jgi:hypothetical protein